MSHEVVRRDSSRPHVLTGAHRFKMTTLPDIGGFRAKSQEMCLQTRPDRNHAYDAAGARIPKTGRGAPRRCPRRPRCRRLCKHTPSDGCAVASFWGSTRSAAVEMLSFLPNTLRSCRSGVCGGVPGLVCDIPAGPCLRLLAWAPEWLVVAVQTGPTGQCALKTQAGWLSKHSYSTLIMTLERPAGVCAGDAYGTLSVHPCHALFVAGRRRDHQVHSATSLWPINLSVSLNDSPLPSASQTSMLALQATCFRKLQWGNSPGGVMRVNSRRNEWLEE